MDPRSPEQIAEDRKRFEEFIASRKSLRFAAAEQKKRKRWKKYKRFSR